VYGTQRIIHQGRHSPCSYIYPAAPLPAGNILRDSRGTKGMGGSRDSRGSGAFAVIPADCAPPPRFGWLCVCVAYSPQIISRLGYSPNLSFNAAYHTTIYKSPGSTFQGLDKKISGLSARTRAATLSSLGANHRIVAQWPQPPFSSGALRSGVPQVFQQVKDFVNPDPKKDS